MFHQVPSTLQAKRLPSFVQGSVRAPFWLSLDGLFASQHVVISVSTDSYIAKAMVPREEVQKNSDAASNAHDHGTCYRILPVSETRTAHKPVCSSNTA